MRHNVKRWILDREAGNRPAGFMQVIKEVSEPAPDGVWIEITDLLKVFSAFPENKAFAAVSQKPAIGLGDVIEKIAHPIAKALHLPCLDPKTDTLRPGSPCAKRRDFLNKLTGI